MKGRGIQAEMIDLGLATVQASTDWLEARAATPPLTRIAWIPSHILIWNNESRALLVIGESSYNREKAYANKTQKKK